MAGPNPGSHIQMVGSDIRGTIAKILISRRLPSPRSNESFVILHPDGVPMSKPYGYAVLDLEATGLDPWQDRVIAIAVVHLSPEFEYQSEWYTLINPERSIPDKVSRLTGIHDADLVDAPAFASVIDRLVDLLQDRVLVAHNVAFDSCFLLSEFRRSGRSLPQTNSICTLRLAREFDLPAYDLATVCRHLDIPNLHHHNALNDARATAVLFRKFFG